jgi:hypothetical protein
MTHDRDTERLLDLWFADGPTQAPDRVIDVVADRIGRQSQRPGWRLDWRRYAMNTNIKIAAGIAAVLVLAVVGYNVLPGSPGFGGPGPTASPTGSPTPSPIPDAVLNAETQVVHPFPSPAEDLTVRVPVPSGWSTYDDWAMLGPKGTSAPDGIGFALLMATSLFSDPCHGADPLSEAGDEPIGPTVDDLATALVGHKGYVASSPVPVSVDGFSGKRMDLQLPDLGSCKGDFFVFGHPGGSLYAQGPNAIWHLWILDVKGTRVIVIIDDYAGTPAADRAVAQAIVDSLKFTP